VEVTATSNAVVAQMAVVLLLGTVISAAVSGKLSDKIGRRKPFVWASVIMAASFVMGLGFGTYIAIDLALMTEVLPPSVTGGQESAGRDLAILGRLPDHLHRGNRVRAAGNRGHHADPLGALTRIPSVRPARPLAAR
jgi:hypothetical protein